MTKCFDTVKPCRNKSDILKSENRQRTNYSRDLSARPEVQENGGTWKKTAQTKKTHQFPERQLAAAVQCSLFHQIW